MNIGAGAKPLYDFARRIPVGERPAQEPTVGTIRGPLQAKFNLVGGTLAPRLFPQSFGALPIRGMEARVPGLPRRFLQGEPGIIAPLLVVILVRSVRARDPDDLRQPIRECPQDIE